MAPDLDKAYVINGDDLRAVLARNTWVFRAQASVGVTEYTGKLKMPEDVARAVLKEHGRPLDELPYKRTDGEPDSRPAITVSQLAAWFREHEFGTTGHTGDSFGKAANPEAIAETILEDLTGDTAPGHAPEPVVVHAFGCNGECDGSCLRPPKPDKGEPVPDDDVVDAHVCCEHAPGDRELSAIRDGATLLEQLEGRTPRKRVLDYLHARYVDDDLPW